MTESRPRPVAISMMKENIHQPQVAREPPVKGPVRNLTWAGISALFFHVGTSLLDFLYMNFDFFYEHLNEIRILAWPVVICTCFLVPWRIKSTVHHQNESGQKSTLRVVVSSVIVTLSGFLVMIGMFIVWFFLSVFL